jgi:hypothetical protein
VRSFSYESKYIAEKEMFPAKTNIVILKKECSFLFKDDRFGTVCQGKYGDDIFLGFSYSF